MAPARPAFTEPVTILASSPRQNPRSPNHLLAHHRPGVADVGWLIVPFTF